MNNFLHQFSLEIKETEAYIHDGNVIANGIFDILRRQRNDVDRVIVTGSIGKRTAVGAGSDFDIVIFLNNKEPPFTTTVQEIRSVLQLWKGQLKITNFVYDTPMLICFEASGYQFDLSVAGNYKSSYLTQWDGTWQKIKSLQNPANDARLYSPGLSEYAVAFVKEQDAFVHSVIRLAKYWNSTKVNTNEYIGGRSLMMELLAINACNTTNTNDLHLAFKQFLTDVVNFERLKIYFERYYTYAVIPSDVKTYAGTIILDPVNRYNNLGHRQNISAAAETVFKAAARSSLLQLERCASNPYTTYESFRHSGIF